MKGHDITVLHLSPAHLKPEISQVHEYKLL